MVKIVAVTGCLSVLFQKLCFKSCIDMKNARNGPFDRSQNMGPNCGNVFGHLGQSVKSRTGVGCYVGIYALNSILVSRRPEMAMEIGFKNWNRCRMSGLPVDSPLALFWDCKNSPGFV